MAAGAGWSGTPAGGDFSSLRALPSQVGLPAVSSPVSLHTATLRAACKWWAGAGLLGCALVLKCQQKMCTASYAVPLPCL